jgi:hypothetical protein
MTQVFTSPNSAEVGLMQSILQEASIDCEIRNDAVGQAFMGFPFVPELWILRDEDCEDAVRLISEFRHKES